MMLYMDCGAYFNKNMFIVKDLKSNKVIYQCSKASSYNFDEFSFIREYRKKNP